MRNLAMLFKMFYQISPFYIFMLVFTSILSSFQVFFNVLLPKFLIDELLGNQDINKIIIITSVIVLINILFIFINKSVIVIARLKQYI